MSSFHISISATALSALKSRLELTTFPDELDDAGWGYGVPLADIKRLVARWRDGFDWRKAEQQLNALPQFTRDIEVDGFGVLNIHYVHKKSEKGQGLPLLSDCISIGPGGFFEAQKIIPLLTKVHEGSELPTFDVVALSLPGYGFSEGPKKKGFSIMQYAEVAHKLMLALGYNEYVTQGGDWGSTITRQIAYTYGGKYSKAWHTNFLLTSPPPDDESSKYSPVDKEGLERFKNFDQFGSGYFIQQSTKPQTLGYSLADSPVGLLAWIYEKLVGWTDSYPWTDDEVLTWVSIYWFSRSGPAASIRIYYEAMRTRQEVGDTPPSSIPLGTSNFPKELGRIPKSWYPHVGNVVFEAEHNVGGHFAALEQPEQLVADLQQMFGKGGSAYGVVPGRDGYGT
ncbi:Alpha/Beta hydrolase protein [Rhodocollybia butyracea]|uniref:Alpha/Beta hydrolase protein n=1 Tax=Rhodocollybia butyracea TaxID=206335 RepID=A0A9P5UBI8_9AGAR|nr:Alpha/Beta hydrolase protein [Rhodocollybia butyracea]